MGDGNGGPRGDPRGACTSRVGAGGCVGAQPRKSRSRCRRDLWDRPHRCARHQRRRCTDRDGRRLRDVFAGHGEHDDRHHVARVGQERGDARRLDLSGGVTEDRGYRRRVSARQLHVARHRNQPRWHHGTAATPVVVVVSQHPSRPGRGVLRHPELSDGLSGPRRHDVRHPAGSRSVESDADVVVSTYPETRKMDTPLFFGASST